jgi:NAD(P)-dependent dehydrogenase (short-subunit alcohol dehydrogenase family)
VEVDPTRLSRGFSSAVALQASSGADDACKAVVVQQRDLGQDSIRANTVVPGWVMTERQLTLWVNAETEKMLDEAQCLKGRIQPVDLARLVLFLASEDGRMCTTQEFTVDAGWA